MALAQLGVWEAGLVVSSLASVRRTGIMGRCWAGMIVYIVIRVFKRLYTRLDKSESTGCRTFCRLLLKGNVVSEKQTKCKE